MSGNRNRGIGGKLLHKAETTALKHGKSRISLTCSEKNPKAFWMYQRHGYKSITSYSDGFNIWHLMRKDLVK